MEQGALTLKEVASKLGISYRQVKRLVKQHEQTDGRKGLATIETGLGEKRKHRRVTEDQLDAFVSRRRA